MEYILVIIILLQISLIFKNRIVFYLISTLLYSFMIYTHYSFFYEYQTIPPEEGVILKHSYLSKEDYQKRYVLERIAAYYIYSDSGKIIILSKDAENFAYDKYLSVIYANNQNIKEITFNDSYNEVYNKYIETGGCEISKEDIEKADFQKLLDKKYVLTCK